MSPAMCTPFRNKKEGFFSYCFFFILHSPITSNHLLTYDIPGNQFMNVLSQSPLGVLKKVRSWAKLKDTICGFSIVSLNHN